MKRGKLIILSAPSGTGKTSICKELLKRNKKWKFSISATTREKRSDEVDGVDYHFMPLKQFEHKENFGEFLEWQFVHGNRYATPIEPIEEAIENNEIMLLDIDVKGSMNIIEEFEADAISIFIEPPWFDDEERLASLTQRLKRRDGQSETLINQRLKRYNLEMEYKEKFTYHFTNDDFKNTTVAIENKIKELTK